MSASHSNQRECELGGREFEAGAGGRGIGGRGLARKVVAVVGRRAAGVGRLARRHRRGCSRETGGEG